MKKLFCVSGLIFSVLFFDQRIFCADFRVDQSKIVRFALWAQAEAFPGIEFTENPISIPVEQLKTFAPYILGGMIYGFSFDYTPSDKARDVKEFFEIMPNPALSLAEKSKIIYEKPWLKENKVWCWIKFERSEENQKFYEGWKSICSPRIRGRGFGKLSDGFLGIQDAFSEAIKNAIREYARKIEKNKPKEIYGTILLNEPPQIGIDAGRYVVTLDFFLQTDKIVKYTKF